MSEYTTLNTILSELVKQYNRFQLADHSKDSLDEGNVILSNGVAIVQLLKSYVKKIESVLADCKDFIDEVEEDLSQQPREEDFLYHTANGMLSYICRDLITKKSKIQIPPAIQPQHNRVFIKEINYHLRLPQVTNLKQIPPMFYLYKTDIYCCISPNVYLQIPFSEMIDSTDHNRARSIKCKYKTKSSCSEQRNRMAKYHNTTTRTCNFAHSGEEIIRIGYPSRCASIPSFGNPATLTKDITNIDIDDIKNILLYGLSDCFTAAIWLDYHKPIQPLTKLNIC